MDSSKLKRMRVCSVFLEYPGDEVVRELIDEVERLQDQFRQCRRSLQMALMVGPTHEGAVDKFDATTERICKGSEGA